MRSACWKCYMSGDRIFGWVAMRGGYQRVCGWVVRGRVAIREINGKIVYGSIMKAVKSGDTVIQY